MATDRVLSPGAVELPAQVRGERLLCGVGEVLYLHQRWAGVLYVLDAVTLEVRETISDVHGIALDRAPLSASGPSAGGAPFVVTPGGLSRLGSSLQGGLVARRYDGSPVEMTAVGGRVYVLADGALQVYDANLAPITILQEEDASLHGLVSDGENDRLYVGSYDGLYALDVATDRLIRTSANVGDVVALAVDPAGQRLFALTKRPSDWFGATDVVTIDTETWQTQTLYSTLSGQLRDLVYDEKGHRLLVVSSDDHALIPIGVPPGKPTNEAPVQSTEGTAGKVGRRFPLGVEVVEVIVSTSSDHLYTSDSAGWVHVLDRRTYKERGRVYGGRHISLDETHGWLYAGDERVPVVSVYDARSLKLERVLPQPGKPRANPSVGQVVIVNRKFYVYDGESGQLAGELRPDVGEPPEQCPVCYYTVARDVVIDGQRGLVATITYTPWPGKAGPEESVDYDLVSGRAYYGLITGGYVHYSSIATHPDLGHLEERKPPVLRMDGLGGQIKLDASARRLYVARGNVLFVLDSETLNRIGRVYTEGWTPVLAAVDGELGRMYTALGSELLVWTRAGGASPAPLAVQSIGVTNTVASIQPSPNYARDGTLLAQIDGRLARTTDRGQTWQRLRGGLPHFGEYEPTVSAVFSPDYANDRSLFAGVYLVDTHGEGVYCSDDGGDTWHTCSDGLYDLRVYRVVPSPDYARDRTLLAYARTSNGEALYRSTDGGDSWSVVVRQTSWGKPPLPRVEEMYYVEGQPLPRFDCDYQGVCQRSDDEGETWMPLYTGGVQLDRYVSYALSPHYVRDDSIYFLTESDLYRYDDRYQAWSISTLPVLAAATGGKRDYPEHLTSLAVAATGGDTHDLFLGSAAGEFYRLAAAKLTWAPVKVAPAIAPLPTRCVQAVDPRLLLRKGDGIDGLGCAVGPARESGAAFQPFERGYMFWRDDLRWIYVLQGDGTWASSEDTWNPELSEPDLIAPQGLYAPVRGFARVWVHDLKGPPSSIGWGTAPERGYTMVVQPFAHGMLLSGTEGEVYALYDDGTWEQP
jgi:photosystem II stability/assembly factor-like uncharacterized protein